MAHESLHENADILGDKVIDTHRALVSLMEELEAVDWYNQRVAATHDDELRAILTHNRDEEMEHAAMVLEWLRRNNAAFAPMLRKFLFTEQPLGVAEEPRVAAPVSDGSLHIGSLK